MNRKLIQAAAVVSLVAPLISCGKAKVLSREALLGDAVMEGTGGTRTDGVEIGTIYPVTQVIPATSGNPYATTTELPFTGAAVAIGQNVVDGQTPFSFSYSYPANNYKLSAAHLVIDTRRDSSDTEGIFIDGVLSGRPPTSMVRTSSPRLLFPVYAGNTAGYTPNTFFIDWSLAHYKQLTRNTFDLNLDGLLTPTSLTTLDVVRDGFLPVVTGDDSPVYQGFLVLKGYTISKTALQCVNSPSYTFENVFLHNDGNSVGQSFFVAPSYGPFGSWGQTASQFQSAEWFYDAQLPRVNTANISIAQATITLSVRRNSLRAGMGAAIAINGVGVSQASFDRAKGSAGIEGWESEGEAYWETFVSSIPDSNVETAVTLNLVSLLGAERVRNLIAQGKLNIALAGSLGWAKASAASTSRTFGSPVSGPELNLSGTYFTELCAVPDDPNSPLSDSQSLPSESGDTSSPIVSSVQAGEVTSSSAVIQWLTHEPADSQVGYGVGNTATLTTKDASLSTFHRVQLTELQPYKVYQFHVKTADANGNLTTSGIFTFQTLR